MRIILWTNNPANSGRPYYLLNTSLIVEFQLRTCVYTIIQIDQTIILSNMTCILIWCSTIASSSGNNGWHGLWYCYT